MTAAGTKKRENKIGITHSEKIFYFVVNLLLGIFFLLVLLPLINIVASSFSTADAVGKGKVLLWPVQPTFEGYTAVFTYKGIWRAYANTIFYTVAGTAMDMAMTLMAAYPLARRNLPLKKPVIMLFMFTMLFSGGMTASYIIWTEMFHIKDTIWALILPVANSTYNMIIIRTAFQSIPDSLIESAQLDGANDLIVLIRIVLPLSKATLATMLLFYSVTQWHS